MFLLKAYDMNQWLTGKSFAPFTFRCWRIWRCFINNSVLHLQSKTFQNIVGGFCCAGKWSYLFIYMTRICSWSFPKVELFSACILVRRISRIESTLFTSRGFPCILLCDSVLLRLCTSIIMQFSGFSVSDFFVQRKNVNRLFVCLFVCLIK